MERIKGKIEAVSGPKEHQGKMQIGFIIGGLWYNIIDSEEKLKANMETAIKKGNILEFDHEFKVVKFIIGFEPADTGKKEEGDWQDDIVNFETLLDAAHKKNENFSIETDMLAIDVEKKYALFKAVITVNKDEKEVKRFEAHGDATAENITGEFIKPHFIRMAETRSICRALRWYTNNAACSEEEKAEPDKKEPAKKPEQKK